jgi:hypothetical protein
MECQSGLICAVRITSPHFSVSELAADLVRRQVNVLVAGGGSGLVAKAATTAVPIVAAIGQYGLDVLKFLAALVYTVGHAVGIW